MKIARSSLDGNPVDGAGPGWVSVRGVVHRGSILVSADGTTRAWTVADWSTLAAEDFGPVAELHPEIVLLGSGNAFHLPAPAVIRQLVEAGIGVEAMATQAACRTFNILAGEGRRVAAALIIEAGAPAARDPALPATNAPRRTPSP